MLVIYILYLESEKMASEHARPNGEIAKLLQEERRFRPTEAFRSQTVMSNPQIYEEAHADLEAFWAKEAQRLHWFQPWKKVLDWKPPHAKWFTGGKLNVAYNCLDHQIALG